MEGSQNGSREIEQGLSMLNICRHRFHYSRKVDRSRGCVKQQKSISTGSGKCWRRCAPSVGSNFDSYEWISLNRAENVLGWAPTRADHASLDRVGPLFHASSGASRANYMKPASIAAIPAILGHAIPIRDRWTVPGNPGWKFLRSRRSAAFVTMITINGRIYMHRPREVEMFNMRNSFQLKKKVRCTNRWKFKEFIDFFAWVLKVNNIN